MKRLAIAVLLLCVPAAAAQAPVAPVTVPFELLAKGKMHSGHIAVQATINGKGPYRLIFDTGAPMMLISTRIAREAGLLKSAARKPAGKSLFAAPGQVTIERFELGGLTAHDLAAFSLDHPTVAALAKVFGPIDGIVGFPFFARYRTAIDYQARSLTMSPNGYQPADVMQSIMTTLMTRSRDRNKPLQPRILVPAAQWGLRVSKEIGDDEPGVVVAEVLINGAAASAGLKPGDRLLTLNGRWTDSEADLFEAASTAKAGQPAKLILRRGGRDLRVSLTPLPGL